MYSNGKTVPGEYPVSYCMNWSEGYGTVRKANKDELGRNLVLVKTEANF